jgi:hypothetical protein
VCLETVSHAVSKLHLRSMLRVIRRSVSLLRERFLSVHSLLSPATSFTIMNKWHSVTKPLYFLFLKHSNRYSGVFKQSA